MPRAEGSHDKADLIAIKRFQLPLEWLSALWDARGPGKLRAIHLSVPPSTFMIIPDGCPWGIGSVLCDANSGTPIEAMADDLSPEDAINLGIAKGSSSCQAISEALAVLVSVHTWKSKLRDRPLTLQLRDDSSAALALSSKLASSSPALNFIGAELALLLEETLVESIAGSPNFINFSFVGVLGLRGPLAGALVVLVGVNLPPMVQPFTCCSQVPRGSWCEPQGALVTAVLRLSKC